MDTNLFLWLTAVVTPVIALSIIFRFMSNKPRKICSHIKFLKQKTPPEADGGWPFVGHSRLLSGKDPPHLILSDMADKYGPVFNIRLGVHRAVIVSSRDAAKECFTTNDVIFSNRPQTAAIRHMSYNFAMFGFSPNISYWRELRKIAVRNLLSRDRVASLGDTLGIEIRTLMAKLHRSCSDHAGVKAPVEMKSVFGDLTFDTMARIVAGDGVVGGERFREAIRGFFRLMGTLTAGDALPFLKWLDYFGGVNAAFEKTGKEMDGVLQAWLDECKKQAKGGRDYDKDEGFMARMMVATAKVARDFPEYDGADTIVKATCQSMMLGGTDMMTATLTWALCLLLNKPSTITRAQQELDTHVGRGRQVKASDVDNLIYIQAIIKETLRLHAPPLSPPRESSEHCTVAGYHIPAGTRLIINLWKLHRDPRVWTDPLEFKPERFLTGDTQRPEEVDVRGLHFELLPFGSGRRVCPGISFALQLMSHALSSLLHGFCIETVSDEPVDMTGSLGSTNMKATPLEVRLTPRLSPTVYA